MCSAPATTHNLDTWADAPTSHTKNFDPAHYVTMPAGDATEMVAMIDDLGLNAPGDLAGKAAQALANMRAKGVELQKIMRNVLVTRDDSDIRPTLYELTAYWRGAYARTKAVVDLRSESPERAQARECQDILFTEGIEFTTRASSAVLVESQVRLDLLEDPGLRAAFVRINCDWYLTALEHAHKVHLDYCNRIKRGALVPGSSVEISLAMFAARLAVLAYARWIVAHIDETQPETIAWAAAALAPIDALREQKRQQMAKAEAKRAEAQKPAAGAAPPVTPAPAPASKPISE